MMHALLVQVTTWILKRTYLTWVRGLSVIFLALSSMAVEGAAMVLMRWERGVGVVNAPGGATVPLRMSIKYRPNACGEN